MVATSFTQFANEIRSFNDRRTVINTIRRDLRKPIPELRKEIRVSAKSTLPTGGGLAAWVARASISVRLRDRGRAAGVKVKMSRKAGDGDKADLNKLNTYGELRHPLHGNRGHWYRQTVPPGFFDRPWEAFRPKFLRTCDQAFDQALEVIRRG